MGDLSVLEALGVIAGVIAIVLGGMWFMLKLAFRSGMNDKMLRDLVDRVERLPCAERKEEINDIKADIVVVKADIVDIKADIVVVKADIVDIKADLVVVKADIVDIKADLVVVKADIVDIKADMVVVKADIVDIKADIVGIKVEIAGINTKLDSIEMSLFCINFTLVTIKGWIMKQDGTMIDPLSAESRPIKRNSPRALSKLGHEIIKIINGMKFLEDHKDFLFDLIDKENPKAALDVETSAYSVCFSSLGNDIFIPMKNIIYYAAPIKVINKGGEEVDFNMDIFNACSVLSIPLRDMYLLEHPSLLQ